MTSTSYAVLNQMSQGALWMTERELWRCSSEGYLSD
jgi:hypothetical protein